MEIHPHSRYQTSTELIRDLRTIVGNREPVEEVSGETPVATSQTSPTILCVENRLKQQDSLREYFNKHGYRVLLLRDIDRAIKRVEASPPSGIVLMADSLGEDADAISAYNKAVVACRKSGTVLVMVLNKKHLEIRDKLAGSPHSRVLAEHPVTLRGIRVALEEMRPKE